MSKANKTLLLASLAGLAGASMVNIHTHDTKPIIAQPQDEKERALAQANAKRERKRLRNALINLGK